MARATIKEVAQAAGVGVGTASRALTDTGSVSPDARNRVLHAAKALGYQPNMQARALRNSRTSTVALLIPDVRNPFFAELAHAFEQEIAAAGYTLLVGNSNEDDVQQNKFLQAAHRHQVDGLALAPQGGSVEVLQALMQDGVPTVFVDRTVPGLEVPSVAADPEPGIRHVVSHLLERGHRRIGYIAGPQSISTGRERLEAWRAALQAKDHSAHEELTFYGDFRQESGRVGAQELLAKGVTALFAADSPMTIGALEACHELGLRVGCDVDMIGFDDLWLFRHWMPPLTTVSQDVSSMGHAAAKMLLDVIAGSSPASIREPTHLVERQSTHYLHQPEEVA